MISAYADLPNVFVAEKGSSNQVKSIIQHLEGTLPLLCWCYLPRALNFQVFCHLKQVRVRLANENTNIFSNQRQFQEAQIEENSVVQLTGDKMG